MKLKLSSKSKAQEHKKPAEDHSLLASMAILETSHGEVDVAAVQLLGLCFLVNIRARHWLAQPTRLAKTTTISLPCKVRCGDCSS